MAKRTNEIPLRLLRSEKEYEAALDEIECYFDKPPKRGTPAADRFEVLALIIEEYERRKWPIDPPHPIDAIRFQMDARGYSQADLGRLLGNRQRASNVLSGRRPLTREMIWKLNREWGIPAEALIRPTRPHGKTR